MINIWLISCQTPLKHTLKETLGLFILKLDSLQIIQIQLSLISLHIEVYKEL